jgi:hypothetical protein
MRWWILVVLASGAAAAQPAPNLDKTVKHEVLWGRFSIELPRTMRVVPNPRDSLGLALPRTLSTRAVLDEEGGRFVMIVTDTLMRMPYDFKSAVIRELSGSVIEAKIAEDQHRGYWAVHVDPVLPRTAADPNLVHATYVKGPDDRVTVFAFYLFGDELRPYAESWARAARDAAAGITYRSDVGILDREGTMMVGDKLLTITVPRPWAVFGLVTERGRGEGLLLREEGRLGVPAGACTIDRGLSTAPLRVGSTPARWLGRPTRWRHWQTNSDQQAEIEVKFGDLRVRTWCSAGNADGLREAQRIVGEMTIH